MNDQKEIKLSPWREKIWTVIFGTDTPSGKLFDVVLLVLIMASVVSVMLETVDFIEAKIGRALYIIEWVFTVFFTIEYILRLISTRRPWRYALSFYGIIDLLAVIPTYLSLFFAGTHYLIVVRGLRLLRVFRIFKLTKFLRESSIIMKALRASRTKITVFLVFILLMVIIVGSLMYLIEGGVEGSKFSSIPRSIYWAIVTITTVGYGDIHPTTSLGQFLAAIMMIMGYGVIAVPTGIVSAEIARFSIPSEETCCRSCGATGHGERAKFCDQCGAPL